MDGCMGSWHGARSLVVVAPVSEAAPVRQAASSCHRLRSGGRPRFRTRLRATSGFVPMGTPLRQAVPLRKGPPRGRRLHSRRRARSGSSFAPNGGLALAAGSAHASGLIGTRRRLQRFCNRRRAGGWRCAVYRAPSRQSRRSFRSPPCRLRFVLRVSRSRSYVLHAFSQGLVASRFLRSGQVS